MNKTKGKFRRVWGQFLLHRLSALNGKVEGYILCLELYDVCGHGKKLHVQQSLLDMQDQSTSEAESADATAAAAVASTPAASTSAAPTAAKRFTGMYMTKAGLHFLMISYNYL